MPDEISTPWQGYWPAFGSCHRAVGVLGPLPATRAEIDRVEHGRPFGSTDVRNRMLYSIVDFGLMILTTRGHGCITSRIPMVMPGRVGPRRSGSGQRPNAICDSRVQSILGGGGGTPGRFRGQPYA
jgi:hypothetical protein